MKKIPTIFRRNLDKMEEVLPEWHPDCLWVRDGEGIPLRKYDGACCMIDHTGLYKRRIVRPGQAIEGFILCDTDPNTGKSFGWVPVDPKKPENKWFMEAYEKKLKNPLGITYGTCELLGPKVQGNPEGLSEHKLFYHEFAYPYDISDRSFEGIREFLRDKDIEGIVFWHSDGRKGKIKKRDFGMRRKPCQ